MAKTLRDSLLVFDGDCAFCTLWVERLREALPVFPETRPWQWTEIADYALSQADVDQYAWYITPSRQFAGHLALSAILRSQPGFGLRLAGWLLATPPWSWTAGAGYRLIARYRHLLPGGTPACAMPRG